MVRSGRATVGIEFGSTRIKAALVAPDGTPPASGSHAGENRLRDGVWTYDMADVWEGLSSSYAALVEDVRARLGVGSTTFAALGISGMMHGYVALDADGNLMVPFRTWRNTITGQACSELTPLLGFAVPQRWSLAHLYQSILEEQPHLERLAHLETLATYVHVRLTGEHAVGLDEASGMFPIDPVSGDWDAVRMATFDSEGGAWGMAVLAAYTLRDDSGQSLPDYLDSVMAGSLSEPITPDPSEVSGFESYLARHTKGLAIERAAVQALE